MSASSFLDYVRLPAEQTEYERRYLQRMNRIALGFFWLNLPLFVSVAFFNGTGPLLAVLLTTLTLAGPSVAVAMLDNPRTISLVHGFTAMCLGGLLVHFGQGPMQIEMHFYFFSLLAVLAMFGNPMVIVVAAVTVTLHHTVIWALVPRSVFNYDASIWVVAVHAAFVVVESVAACFIARSFFDDVIGLDKLVRERTSELERRNQDLRAVLDNVQQGFITVDRDGRLATERSSIVDRWFGPAATLQELVADVPEFAERLELGWETLTDGFMPTTVAIHQLPSRLVRGEQVFDFTFEVVEEDDEGVKQVLLVITDVTDAQRREAAEARGREVVAIFHHFLADKSGFLEFFADAQNIVDDIVNARHEGDLVVAKRLLHTLKGNASLFGLNRLSRLVHDIEDAIGTTGDLPSEIHRDALQTCWAEIGVELSDLMGERHGGIELTEAEYHKLIDAVESQRSPSELLSLIHAWQMEPAAVRLQRARDQIRGIAERVDKLDLQIDVAADDIRLSPERFRPFWRSFVHILRNAVDHGIESPAERAASGKSGGGQLDLVARVEGDEFVVVVSDDGRGIDWELIRERARELGLPAETPADLQAALFRDGFTTRRAATLLSGRGIGLGAVQKAVDELGGRITIESDPKRGTQVRFGFPLDRLDGAVWTAPHPQPRQQRPEPPVGV